MCSQTRFTAERTNIGQEERNSRLTTEAERQDDTPGPSPQSVAAMKGTNPKADIANAAAVVHGPVGCKITNNQDTEQSLRQNMSRLERVIRIHGILKEGKLCIEGRKIHDQKNNIMSIESQIKIMEKTLEQQEAFANVEDRRNIRGQLEGLNKELRSRTAELSRLEGEVLPQLMAQRKEVKYQLQKHSNNTKEKVDGIPALEKQLKNLSEKLEQYHNDVSSARKEVSKLSKMITKLETEFHNQTEDERKERKTILAEIQKLRDEDLIWIKIQLRDERKAREASDRENQKLHDEIGEMKTHQMKLEEQLKDMDKHSISGSEANNEKEKRKSPCSDSNREVDKSKRSGSHLHKQVYTDSSTEDNRQGNNDNSARNILRSVKEAMEKETTALQRKAEKRFELPPGKLLTILDAVLEELAQKPKTAELLEKYMECTYDENDNSTGSDAKCHVVKGSGATTSTSGCREPCVSTDHSLNTPGGDAPLQGAALQESGKKSRDPSRTESDKTLNDKDRQRIQEQFNSETRLKVPPGKLLTILEVVLKYADQDRKVTKSGPEEKLAFRK